MTSVTAYKNTIAFALSFAVIPWIEGEGYAKVGLTLAVVVLTNADVFF